MEGHDVATTPWYKKPWVEKVKNRLRCWRQPSLPVKEFGPAPVRFLPVDVGGLRFRVWREATFDWTKSLCSLFLSPDEKEEAVAELSSAEVDSTDYELLERAALVISWKSEVRPPTSSPQKPKKSKAGIPGLPRIQSGIPLLTDTEVSDSRRPYKSALPNPYVDLQEMDLAEHYAESMC